MSKKGNMICTHGTNCGLRSLYFLSSMHSFGFFHLSTIRCTLLTLCSKTWLASVIEVSNCKQAFATDVDEDLDFKSWQSS